MKTKKSLAALALFLLTFAKTAAAQDVEMADTMRSEGKIYVVVAIILIVLTGLFAYLVVLGRKVTKLEDRVAGKQQRKG